MNKLYLFSVVLWCAVSCVSCASCVSCEPTSNNTNVRVCVIGAGVGGLSAARHLRAAGVAVVVLEATRYVGGTWRYDPRVGADENGLPLHTSMYKHLRTNLPKPTMELRGFPLPEHLPSFPSWSQYYCYLKSYAHHYGLMKHIQFLHNVISVERVNETWTIKHQHVLSGEEFEEEYDYVIVATGHHSKPNYPTVPGEKQFKGTIIHSHDFREPAPYRGRRVLVVGAGPSGMDIGLDLVREARALVHSHHSRVAFQMQFPSNYIAKPDVKELNETGAIFVDGTYEDLDDIIYCTGYRYDYPFLAPSCGLDVHASHVAPLHRRLVNVRQPTMLLLGLTVRACLVLALDAQAQYATALIQGRFRLPSEKEMLAEFQKTVDTIKSAGKPLSTLHLLAEKEDQYYADLTRESGIARVPSVMYKIRISDMQAKIQDWYAYRNYTYTVLDDHSFTRTLEPPQRRQHRDACSP